MIPRTVQARQPLRLQPRDHRGDRVLIDIHDPPFTEPRHQVPAQRRPVELVRPRAQVRLRRKPLLPHFLECSPRPNDEPAAPKPRLHLRPREPRVAQPAGNALPAHTASGVGVLDLETASGRVLVNAALDTDAARRLRPARDEIHTRWQW
jgi:hypothetical protein